MKSLADIKRRAVVGAKLKLIEANNPLHRFLHITREVAVASAKGIGLRCPTSAAVSYLDWPKATSVEVLDSNTFKIETSDGPVVLVYQFV